MLNIYWKISKQSFNLSRLVIGIYRRNPPIKTWYEIDSHYTKTMPTTFTWRTIPITSYAWRDPVWRKYLSTESGEILTTEDGKWIIAIDSQNTQYTTDRQYIGQTWNDLWVQTWNSLGTMIWDDLYTWVKPTIYTSRTPI